MTALLRLLLVLLTCLSASLSACLTAAGEETRIAVAANFKPVAEELERVFEAETGHDVSLVIGSTAKLYTQIRMAAPFDAFLSADQSHAERLVTDGWAVEQTRFTYAIGQLTLWSRTRAVSADTLSDPEIKRIAIANPALAPYGVAAEEVMTALDASASNAQKLVLGENVGQAFAFVYTRNAEIGLVAVSQVLSVPESKRGYRWDPPTSTYRPVRQDAVLLRQGEDNIAAKAFLAFLQSAPAKAMIAAYGYRIE